MSTTIVITGITGQLGQFLAKYIQENQPNIKIIGTIRHKSFDNQTYIFDRSKVLFELMDLNDVHSIENLIIKYKPDFFVNSAANAFVGESWKVPYQHMEQNTLAVLHQLESIRKHSPFTRYFNMGSSEEFGCVSNNGLQDENTKIEPKSPYGCSKAAARYLVNVYRKSYNLYALQNYTFNFESEARGEKYVTKKISLGVARINNAIKNKKDFEPIELGNLNSYRSWQFAGDVADSIWRCLNQEYYSNTSWDVYFDKQLQYKHYSENIKEYVVSSSECHSIREFVELAFDKIGLNGKWVGSGLNEQFIHHGLVLVKVNPEYFRPVDVTFLSGDASLIKKDLDWKETLSFKELVSRMVDFDVKNFN